MSDEKKELERVGENALKQEQAKDPIAGKTTQKPKEMSAEEAAAKKASRKAELAHVLTRGVLNVKLQEVLDTYTPSDRVGKFVRDVDESLIRYKNLGYDFIYSKAKLITPSVDGRIRVGDVVLMTVSREDREILREVRSETTRRRLIQGKEEFLSNAQKEAEKGGAVPFDNSQTVIDRR